MNIHVSESIQKEWSNLEFRGKKRMRNGFTVISARHKELNVTGFYVFEINSWVDRETLNLGIPEGIKLDFH